MIDYYETSDRRTLSLLELSRLCEKHMISEEGAAQSAPQREPSGGGVASSLGQAVLDQLRSLSGDDEPATLTLTANDRSADSQRLRKFDDRIVSPKRGRRPSCFARCVHGRPTLSSMSNTFEQAPKPGVISTREATVLPTSMATDETRAARSRRRQRCRGSRPRFEACPATGKLPARGGSGRSDALEPGGGASPCLPMRTGR